VESFCTTPLSCSVSAAISLQTVKNQHCRNKQNGKAAVQDRMVLFKRCLTIALNSILKPLFNVSDKSVP